MQLVMSGVPVERQGAWRATYALNDPGFRRTWWDRNVRDTALDRNEFYRWTLGECEVVRAHVQLDTKIHAEYEGFGRMPELVQEILFFEVRVDHQGRGLGREAVRQLEEQFPDRILTAFSEQADEFWARAGWRHHHRVDGGERYRPLFVRFPPRLA